MNKFIINIAAVILLTSFSNQFCQVTQNKIIQRKEVEAVKHKSTFLFHKEHPKPKGEIIVVTKPTRKINLPNPPHRAINKNIPAKTSQQPKFIAHHRCCYPKINHKKYYDRARSIEGDYNFEIFNKPKEDVLIEEKKENYYPIIKYLKGKEFTDKNFPLCIKKIAFDYAGTQWIDSDDLPESMIDKQSGEYLIYKIKFDAYVFDLCYQYPFAILITYPDYSNDIIIYNYDSQNLKADSVYSFEEVMPLKSSGYAWLTLGYFDLEYEQFYSAALSPYITKQKVYIPLASR